MFKKATPFKQDSYRSRSGRIDALCRPDNIYAKTWLVNLLVFACVCVDLYCIKVLWNLVMEEDYIFVWMSAAACAVALDVPLAIAGNQVKRCQQGMCSRAERNAVLILAVAIFAVAFIGSFLFRIDTRELTYSVGTAGNLVNTMSAGSAAPGAESGGSSVLVAAVYGGIIPLLTSLVSFVVSYLAYDPLGIRLQRLEKERVGLQSNILEAEKALAEAETAEEYCRSLIARENDLFRIFMSRLDADALELKQVARVLIMEKQKTPDELTAVSREAAELMQEHPVDERPEQELAGYINGQLNRGGDDITEAGSYVA